MGTKDEIDFDIPIYEAARVFNVSTEDIVEALEEEGLSHSVTGNGLNARVTGKKAELALRKKILDDEEAAERLEKIRTRREHQSGPALFSLKPSARKPEPFGVPTHDLVKDHDEGVMLEFKETARYHIYKESFDKDIKMEIVKTVSSFMNSKGGVLVIGVSDDGNVKGLKRDNFSSSDDAKNFMSNLLLSNIGIKCQKNVSVKVEKIEDKMLVRVECEKSSQPSFIKKSNGESMMYIRYLESTVKLDAKGLYEYIPHRFLDDIAAKNYDRLANNLGRMSATHPSGDGL